MINGKIMNKKSAFVAFLLALCMSLTAFAFGRTVRADELPAVDEKPTENVMLDMDGTQSWLEVDGTKVTQLHKDNAIGNGFFPGAKGESMMMFTEQIANDGLVAVKLANRYKAENFSSVTVRLVVGNGVDSNTNVLTLNGYGLSDTECASSAGNIEISKGGNANVDLILDAAKLADADGYISGFMMKKTETMTEQTGQIFADYVELALAVEKAPTENLVVDCDNVASWVEVDGEKVTNCHPDNAIPGLFPGADGSSKMMFTEQIAHEGTLSIKFAKKIKAEYFEKIKVDLVIGNWADTGNAVTTTAYALTDTAFAKPAGKIKTLMGNVYKVLSVDPAIVADADGYIEGFVLRKTETDTTATGQYFVNGVEFCLVGSEPKPVVSEEYIEKDISEVMPVGSGVTFEVKTSEETLNKTTVNASVKAGAFDKLNLKITPNAEGKFSAYILMKAPTATATFEDGGIFFWISDSNLVIGNKDNNESAVKSEFPANAFESGKTTKVSLSAISYYLAGELGGYYCAVTVEDATEPLVEIYLPVEDVTSGVYTNICTQDPGENYTIAFGSASETPKAASEVMNVKIATKSGKDSFTTPRAALDLTYFEAEGTTVGDLVIDGDATFDKETGFLTFGKKGTVKVKYSVTNAFGTFESNELTLTYDDGSKDNSGNGGCGSSVAGAGMLGLAALGMAAFAIGKRRK